MNTIVMKRYLRSLLGDRWRPMDEGRSGPVVLAANARRHSWEQMTIAGS